MTTLLGADDVRRAIARIAHEIVERDRDPSRLALVGIRARGDVLASRLHEAIKRNEGVDLPLGALDITLYRDDLTQIASQPVIKRTDIPASIDGRSVILVDDVLYTGRTVRAALDELIDFGRPSRIQLCVLVDRGGRELPIQPDFVGLRTKTASEQIVQVRLAEEDGEDRVELLGPAPAAKAGRAAAARGRRRGRR